MGDGEWFFEFQGYEFGDWHGWVYFGAMVEVVKRGKGPAAVKYL